MDEVYEQYAKLVYRYLYRLCGNTQDAEDMTAETFYQAVKSIDRFRGDCKLLTWLCQIARHVWYHELERRKKINPSLPLDSLEIPGPSMEDQLEEREEKLSLYQKMQQLEPEVREVMYLRLSGELSFKEIGLILGKSENWARVVYYRGKERLKNNE